MRRKQGAHDAAGRPGSLSSSATSYAPSASVSSIGYAAHNALNTETYGNGLIHAVDYNNRLQPTQIKLGTSNSPTSVVSLGYSYGSTNNNGNVQTHSYSGGGLTYTQTFGYDSLNRLTTANENSGASWSQTNAYDRYGNRWINLGGGIQNLYFDTANNRITGGSYDAAGNLLNDDSHSYTYDAENKIAKVDNVSAHVYNGEGQRVRKLVGENLRFIYGIGGQLIAEFSGSTGVLQKEYIYGASGLLATIEPTALNSNGTRYTTPDHLGSPRVVTNSGASVVSRHDYMPFGEELNAGVGGRTTGMGFPGSSDGIRQKFTAKERDLETGLDYFNARYYGSTQGRFTSPDPTLLSVDGFNPQTWNRYTYVLNNPLAYVDPLGLWALQSETIYKKDKDGNLERDRQGRLKVDHVVVTAVRTSDKDTGASLARQLGLSGKAADSFGQRVGSNDNIRLSEQRGDVGRIFGAVEQGLKEQAKFEIEHSDRPNQGPDSADCSETACRIAFPHQMLGTVTFSVQEADATIGTEGATTSVQESNLRLGDIVRWADARNNPKHFASFIFRNDGGVPIVFSKSGVGGPYETITTSEIGAKYPQYGTIRGLRPGQTGYYHPR